MPLIPRFALVLTSVLLLHSCQKPTTPLPLDPPTSPGEPVVVAPAPPPANGNPSHSPPPIVTRNPDGTVKLEGVDRWGQRIEATYESVEWLEKALPVLSRGLTDSNAIDLEKSVKALPR